VVCPARGVHPSLEVRPPLLGQIDVSRGDLRRAFREDVEQDHQSPRASVEDSVEVPSVVAARLAQLSFDLRAVWEGQVRDFVGEQVEPSDLILDRRRDGSVHSMPPSSIRRYAEREVVCRGRDNCRDS
jgi:hypothetical protein